MVAKKNLKPKKKPKPKKKAKAKKQQPVNYNKNVINIVEGQRGGAQIPNSPYIPDRFDKTPYIDQKLTGHYYC